MIFGQLAAPQNKVLKAAGAITTTTTYAVEMPDNYVGVTFILDANTVSGTSPTLDVSIEVSNDGGTTYFGVARFAQVTAAAERILTLPTCFLPGVGTTISSSVLVGYEGAETTTTGGAAVAHITMPFKHLRANATVGGTNPSFNFTLIGSIQCLR